MIDVAPGYTIDERDLTFSFVRSGGPGGQNVNKVSTAAQLRFDPGCLRWLSADARQRLLALAGSRATLDGIIIISASRFRTQERNRADAEERLVALIQKALVVSVKRKAGRPTHSSRRRRIIGKRLLGEKKRLRRNDGEEFD
jgi:ribosome-associated protein